MTDLNDILIFVKVAQFESISKAARSLGMSISTVSRRLSLLESALGAALVRRNTRRVTLTPQGREYFNQCDQPLTLIQEAERVLTQAQRKPEGMLRLTVPMILGQDSFLEFLSRFSRQHAGIRIDLVISNHYLDLVADNIDLAIRFGELRESRLVASRLGKWIRYVVATPDYLSGRKLPVRPEELKSHECVMLNAKSNEVMGAAQFHGHGLRNLRPICNRGLPWCLIRTCGQDTSAAIRTSNWRGRTDPV